MGRSIHTREYAAVLRLLRQARKAAGLTQVQVAERLAQSQSFVTKMERGDRRLDVVQLRTICGIYGSTLPEFVARLEAELDSA